MFVTLPELKVRSSEPTKEDTLNALLKKLHEKRCSAGRPEELEVWFLKEKFLIVKVTATLSLCNKVTNVQ